MYFFNGNLFSGFFEEKKLNNFGSLGGEGICKQFWKKKLRSIFKIGKGKGIVFKVFFQRKDFFYQ